MLLLFQKQLLEHVQNLFSVSDQPIFFMVDNSLQTCYPVFKTAIQLNLKHLHRAENNFCCIHADTLRNFLNKKKKVQEKLFHARAPFKDRGVVVWDREVLTLQPFPNVGVLRAQIRLSGSGSHIPSHWEIHLSRQPGVTCL